MLIFSPGWEGQLGGSESRPQPLVARLCAQFGIAGSLSQSCPEGSLRVPLGGRLLCSKSSEVLRMGTTRDRLAYRGRPGSSVSIFFFRYNFGSCVRIFDICSIASDVFRRV